ncbi:MAG: S-layer homology domain-containing protein [Chloroflexota bacterium]
MDKNFSRVKLLMGGLLVLAFIFTQSFSVDASRLDAELNLEASQSSQTHIPLMYWPMSDSMRHITSFPNSSWTHQLLGLNPGSECPPYNDGFTLKKVNNVLVPNPDSHPYWRDTNINYDVDRNQVMGLAYGGSVSNRVACYTDLGGYDHEGTDILDWGGGETVFAVADGVVDRVTPGVSSQNRTIIVDHNRTVDGVEYTWTVRYTHVGEILTPANTIVAEGDPIALVGAPEDHLHFEVENLNGGVFNGSCVGACIINPWGYDPNYNPDEFNLWVGGHTGTPCAFDSPDCETGFDGCPSPNTAFCDVPTTNVHYDAIEELYQRGYVQGVLREVNGEFKRFFDPDEPIMRQHAAYLAGRWLYSYSPSNAETNLPPALGLFPDLTGNSEAERVMEQFYRDGILNGYTNGLMGPTDSITREQFSYIIGRILLKHDDIGTLSCVFPDTNNETIRWLCDLGVVKGKSNGYFDPGGNITRAEAATMTCRAFLNCQPVVSNPQLSNRRSNARVPSPLGQLCFTASNSVSSNAIPGVSVPTDGDEVCYDPQSDEYSLRVASSEEYIYRMSPTNYDDAFYCEENGIVSLELYPHSTSLVRARLEKCDGNDLSFNGTMEILVDGNIIPSLTTEYDAGDSKVDVEFDPILLGLTGSHDFVARVISVNDNPNDYKYSKPVAFYATQKPLEQDYSHHVSTSSSICEPSGILEYDFDITGYMIRIDIEKCNGQPFNTAGEFYIYVDGVETWGPFPLEIGERTIGANVDHYGEFGLFPTQSDPVTYQVKLFTNGVSAPRVSHTVDVWTTFSTLCHTLDFQTNPLVGGTVDVVPAPNCGSKYTSGTNVTLTANPSQNYEFVGWSGDSASNSASISTNLNELKSFTAIFENVPECFTLTVNQPPSNQGQINVLTPPNCENNSYVDGTNVNIQALPAQGYQFDNWTGDASGGEITNVLMTENQSIGADFSEIDDPIANGLIYVSSTTAGTVNGVTFTDEDILEFDLSTNSWTRYFDGSDVGLNGSPYRDVDAFTILDDGSILLSVAGSTTVPDVGAVDDSDIIRFIPTKIGPKTEGSFEMYFDGSDVGLDTDKEDIDAIAVLDDGRIVISTLGLAQVTKQFGNQLNALDEDLIVFTPQSLGANTIGYFALYADGSDIGLDTASEDTWGISINSSEAYFNPAGIFNTGSISGDAADFFICAGASLDSGSTTCTTQSIFFDGSGNGMAGETLDGIHVISD